MTKKIKKRFVAGAKCPQCNALDSMQIYRENEIETVECIECDYQARQTEVEVEKNEQLIGIFKQ